MSDETIPAIEPVPTPAPVADQTPDPKAAFDAEKEKLLAEIHKWKGQAKELSVKSAAEREKLLIEQGRWEELAKEKDAKLRELEERDARTKEAFINEKKYNAVKEAAARAGIRPEAMPDLELIGLDKVQIETTSTGRVNVLGVDAAIDNLKLSRPHWFGSPRTVVAGNAPNVQPGGVVSLQELAKLSQEAAKTGDYTAYLAATKQFKQK